MLVDDKARSIGKVVTLNTDRITAELSRDLESFTINGYDDVHYVGQLNSYVVIPYLNYYIVGEIVSIREKETGTFALNNKHQEMIKSQSVKLFDIAPFGTIIRINRNQLSFSFGVSVYPSLYSDVLYIKDEELDCIYNSQDVETIAEQKHTRSTHLAIGDSTIFKGYKIKIDIDNFFGGHSAVLGNTGSGKSCTVTALLQAIYNKTNYSASGSTFILFDVNGEYHQAIGALPNRNIETRYASASDSLENSFELPHWYFTLDEWELLLHTSEKTQRPILHLALGFSGLFEGNNNDFRINHIVATCALNLLLTSESPVAAGHRALAVFRKYGKGKLSGDVLSQFGFVYQYGNFDERKGRKDEYLSLLDSNIMSEFQTPKYQGAPFNINNLVEYIELAILYEEAHGNKQIRDYCSSMLTRAKNIVDHPSFKFIKADPATAVSQESYLSNILGVVKERENVFKKRAQIYILDLNEAEDDMIEIVTKVISRMLFETLKRLNPRNSFPVNLIMEEAHRYISTENMNGFVHGSNIFERIAKEGRKYGLFLLVSSQRPSELSKTVLSQCSNFIVHRIQNPEDLSHIRQITPHISETLLKRLPSVPKQHALVFGACVSIPSLVKINIVEPRPKSDDNKISLNWFVNPKKEYALSFKNDFFAIQENKIDLQHPDSFDDDIPF